MDAEDRMRSKTHAGGAKWGRKVTWPLGTALAHSTPHAHAQRAVLFTVPRMAFTSRSTWKVEGMHSVPLGSTS